MGRPVLYVAGPYSSDPVLATRAAVIVSTELYRHTEWVPFVPHLTHLWHLITPMPYEDWLRIDFTMLSRCDAITRLPGDSTGADREVAEANRLKIPLIEFSGFPQVVRDAHRYAVGVLA